MAEEKSHESALAAVSLKLPPFWPNDPTIWFAQIEAQFTTRGITSQSTRFAYVVSSLQPEIAQEVRDLLLYPPQENQYDKIKTELIKRTSASEQKRLHQLLISEELGDKKPSQLLRRMRQLLGENVLEENILKQLFLKRLPTNAQLILASTSESVDIDKLAIIADNILEVTPSSSSVVTSVIAAASSSPSREMKELRDMISKLSIEVESLSKQVQRSSRSRTNSRNKSKRRYGSQSRSPSRSENAPTHAGGACWYHWRFGERASKCVPPCTYIGNKSGNQLNENASN